MSKTVMVSLIVVEPLIKMVFLMVVMALTTTNIF